VLRVAGEVRAAFQTLPTGRAAAGEIQIHINRMQHAITQREQEAAELRAGLRPFIDSLPE
jgi:hypothetical protein